ncbi:hypothetical protein M0R45_006112 [Rubus argutus]|uniref:Agglutinin domain-containing protein n=1 Tax=Rubus argutus TaxID=59490 RepID=A0AAW1YQ15_RUBAR
MYNTNYGSQGDIVSGVAGDYVNHVSGDFIKNVHGDVIRVVGGDFIQVIGSDYTRIRLPSVVALKAKYDGKYLSIAKYHPRLPAGFLKFEGREVASLETKFELVKAKTADKPEENKNKISCTLFEPEPVNKSGGLEFRFRHIQLGMYACLWRAEFPFYGGLYEGSKTPDKYECDVYEVIAWESLEMKMKQAVVLPRFVALKSIYNDKYLILSTNHPRLPAGFLKFDGEEAASPLAKFEVVKAKSGNGLVHIRSCYNNKYLVREAYNKNWIVAAADKPEEDEYKFSCTLFEPEPYDENGGLEFRFRHVQLGMYACLWRAAIPFYGGLYGGSNSADQDACDVYTVVTLYH